MLVHRSMRYPLRYRPGPWTQGSGAWRARVRAARQMPNSVGRHGGDRLRGRGPARQHRGDRQQFGDLRNQPQLLRGKESAVDPVGTNPRPHPPQAFGTASFICRPFRIAIDALVQPAALEAHPDPPAGLVRSRRLFGIGIHTADINAIVRSESHHYLISERPTCRLYIAPASLVSR